MEMPSTGARVAAESILCNQASLATLVTTVANQSSGSGCHATLCTRVRGAVIWWRFLTRDPAHYAMTFHIKSTDCDTRAPD